jgi:hypothetical protein
MNPYIQTLETSLAPLQTKINHHTLLHNITTQADIQCWMSHHVFAVWDFVCLIKALASRIIPQQTPWLPAKDTDSVYLMQQILLEEESDQSPSGKHASHFLWYLSAMAECGTNTGSIKTLLHALESGQNNTWALSHCPIPKPAQRFLKHTFSLFDQPTETIAAAFVYGREAMTAGLFAALQQQIQTHQIPHCELLSGYLSRHITLDSEEHLPKARQMLINLCKQSPNRWRRAKQAAQEALIARWELLNGIEQAMRHYSKNH